MRQFHRRNSAVQTMVPPPTEPHNSLAEYKVLAHILADNTVFTDLIGIVAPPDFHAPLHGPLFEAIASIVADGRVADAVTLAPKLREVNLGDASALDYVDGLQRQTGHDRAKTMAYVHEILIESGKRGVSEATREANRIALQPGVAASEIADAIRKVAAKGEQLTLRTTEPTPLFRPTPAAEPYPVDALAALANVGRALNSIVQSPPAMCGSTVLAVATLAAQAHIDVVLPIGSGSVRPVSALFVTVGRTGERKSGTDDQAMRAFNEHETALRAKYEVDKKAYRIARDMWDAERRAALGGAKGAASKIEQVGREADLRAIGEEPQQPLEPVMIMADPTIEGLAKLLLNGLPSVGVFSAEGGQFVGGHAMSDEAKLRSATALSVLWDGTAWKRVRSADGTSTIANRRVSMHLMVQPHVAAQLVNDPVLSDQGLLSRMLVTFPNSTMGARFHREPLPEALATMSAFEATLRERLALPLPLRDGTRNELEPRRVCLAADARIRWIEYSNEVERRLAPGGTFATIAGFAAKAAEHAARLAAVLTWWGNRDAREIDADTLDNAIRLVEHYAGEALRLHEAGTVPADIVDAERLLKWLRERWAERCVSVADVSRVGPNSVRVAQRAKKLIGILVQHGWLVPLDGGATIGGFRRREAWSIWGR